MKNFYSLYPALSLVILHFYQNGRIQRGIVACIVFCLAPWVIFQEDLRYFGFFYVLLFTFLCGFPLLIDRKNRHAIDVRSQFQEKLKNELAMKQESFQQKSARAQKLSTKIEKILERYNFARTLISQTEEEPIFLSLAKIFEKEKTMTGMVFWNLSEEESMRPKVEIKTSAPRFSHGFFKYSFAGKSLWVTTDSTCQQAIQPPTASPQNFMVTVPVRWGSKVQGVLAAFLTRPASDDFLAEISRITQFLGLGFQKADLYRTIVEHSRKDGLTQLYLRRIFMERLNEEVALSKRYGTAFSVLMLDIDNFKRVNDTYGHIAGDIVLKKVADCLRLNMHPGVMICRYGGEEFAVLIGLSPHEEVLQMSENIRRAVENEQINILQEGRRDGHSRSLGENVTVKITVSIGVANYLPDAPAPEELIRRADEALYRAKESGKNCVREWKQ